MIKRCVCVPQSIRTLFTLYRYLNKLTYISWHCALTVSLPHVSLNLQPICRIEPRSYTENCNIHTNIMLLSTGSVCVYIVYIVRINKHLWPITFARRAFNFGVGDMVWLGCAEHANLFRDRRRIMMENIRRHTHTHTHTHIIRVYGNVIEDCREYDNSIQIYESMR